MSTELNFIDFVSVLPETEQLGAHISGVPHCHALVCRARNHQILVEWGVVHTHDLGNVRVDVLGGPPLAHVPNFEFLVVTNRGKLVLIMMVPAHVLNHLRVSVVQLEHRVDCVR